MGGPPPNRKPGSCGFSATPHPLYQLLERRRGTRGPLCPAPQASVPHPPVAQRQVEVQCIPLRSPAGWGAWTTGNSWSRFSREAAAAFLAVCGGEECAEGWLGSGEEGSRCGRGWARRLCWDAGPLAPASRRGRGPAGQAGQASRPACLLQARLP